MDQIKLEVTEIKSLEKSNLKEYDIKVILNGVPMKHNIFNGCEVVPASRFDFAEFDLFTCSCGVAGCAGFQAPVIQNKTDESVKWKFPDDNSYSADKVEYVFNRVNFEEAFESLRSQMLKLEKNKTHLLSCLRDSYDYVGSEEDGGERWEIKDGLKESFKWYADRYEATQNLNNLLKEKFPRIYPKSFKFKYEDKEGETSFDLNYLICRVLNEWPRKPNGKTYLKKAEATGDSIMKIFNEQDYKPFLKLVHKAYERFNSNPEVKGNYNESVFSAFNFELHKLVEEEKFDTKKLQLVII